MNIQEKRLKKIKHYYEQGDRRMREFMMAHPDFKIEQSYGHLQNGTRGKMRLKIKALEEHVKKGGRIKDSEVQWFKEQNYKSTIQYHAVKVIKQERVTAHGVVSMLDVPENDAQKLVLRYPTRKRDLARFINKQANGALKRWEKAKSKKGQGAQSPIESDIAMRELIYNSNYPKAKEDKSRTLTNLKNDPIKANQITDETIRDADWAARDVMEAQHSSDKNLSLIESMTDEARARTFIDNTMLGITENSGVSPQRIEQIMRAMYGKGYIIGYLKENGYDSDQIKAYMDDMTNKLSKSQDPDLDDKLNQLQDLLESGYIHGSDSHWNSIEIQNLINSL